VKKLPTTLPSELFQTEFRRRLGESRFRDAREAWNRLERAGCQPLMLLMDLEIYCSHVVVKGDKRLDYSGHPVAVKRKNRPHYSGYPQEFLQAKRTLADDAEKLARSLTDDANRIEQMKREPEFLAERSTNQKASHAETGTRGRDTTGAAFG
jgi:hypothetical protein